MSTELPDALVDRFLRSLRSQFYKGKDQLFFQERWLLMRAICYPAQWLDSRAVSLNAKRYTDVLTKIIRTINQHGQLSTVRSMGRYLLHCVQTHMQHHGETYYEEAKATRNILEDVFHGLKKRTAVIPVEDPTVPDLAKLHNILKAAKPRRKARDRSAASSQGDLFPQPRRRSP